jgi:hypothetical protein
MLMKIKHIVLFLLFLAAWLLCCSLAFCQQPVITHGGTYSGMLTSAKADDSSDIPTIY